jgi:hypothetical protein
MIPHPPGDRRSREGFSARQREERGAAAALRSGGFLHLILLIGPRPRLLKNPGRRAAPTGASAGRERPICRHRRFLTARFS